MLKRKSLIGFLLTIIMAVSMVSPAFAWKLNTHVYSGNLILEDLKDGYLDIDGMGTYKVPADIYNAVTKYPEAYRAGTLGPDIYPEMATGQGNIHPLSDKADSGKYLQLMVDAYLKLPSTHPQREKIFSFILGYSTHYAGDLFGHSFINAWAEGVFPGMMEMAEDPEKIEIALRHIAAEGYVDSKVPDYQRTGTNIKIDAPVEFIKEVLIDEASREYEVSVYLEPITYLRDVLKEKAETLKAFEGGDLSLSKIAKYGVNTNLAGYAERWYEDIDTGLVEWVKANQDMARAMLDKDKGTSDSIEPISNWIDEHALVMGGAPDALAAYLGFSVDTVLELLDLMTTADLKKKLAEMKKDAVYWAVEEATGVNIDEMMDAIKAPENFVNSPLFETGNQTSMLIDQHLKNFGKTQSPKDIKFDPFYNTVQMGKLILLGQENLNKIFPNSYFRSQKMVESFNKIDVTIKTGKNSTSWSDVLSLNDKATKGTDDDIFFVLMLRDGKIYEKLMDRPGYNDFESNKTDTYTLELPEYITYEDIASVGVRKSSIVNDNWYPDWISVKPRNGNIILESGNGKSDKSFNKVYKGNASWSKSVYATNSIIGYSSFDPTIINFIQSLDDSHQWTFSKMYNNDFEAFGKIFRGFNNDYTATSAISFKGASSWAVPHLEKAVDNGLYTFDILNNFTHGITREEFCELVIILYEKLTDTKAQPAPSDTFSDTDNPEILKAYNLGLVGGVGNGKFAPTTPLSREYLAGLVYNLIKKVKNGNITVSNNISFNDAEQISSWARDAISYCSENNIITGTGNNNFSPKVTATREHAIALVQNIFINLSDDKYNLTGIFPSKKGTTFEYYPPDQVGGTFFRKETIVDYQDHGTYSMIFIEGETFDEMGPREYNKTYKISKESIEVIDGEGKATPILKAMGSWEHAYDIAGEKVTSVSKIIEIDSNGIVVETSLNHPEFGHTQYYHFEYGTGIVKDSYSGAFVSQIFELVK